MSGSVDSQKGFEQGLEELEVEGVGAVGLGVGWVVVDFEKESVDSGGDGGSGEQGYELGLAAADAVSGGGLLDGVGSVKDDRCCAAHDGERAVIDYKVVVSEGGSALGEEYAGVAG